MRISLLHHVSKQNDFSAFILSSRVNKRVESISIFLIVAVFVVTLSLLITTAKAAGNTTTANKHTTTTSVTRVQVTFRENAGIRVRNGEFVSINNFNISALHKVLAKFPDVKIDRLFTQSEESLIEESQTIQPTEKQEVTIFSEFFEASNQEDLNSHFRLTVSTPEQANLLVKHLHQVNIVESVQTEALPSPPPATPNYESRQKYRNAAPIGVDAISATQVKGGNGGRVKIVDVEYAWNLAHEDIDPSRVQIIKNGTPCIPTVPGFSQLDAINHGTAVLGALYGTVDSIGVSGIASRAALGVVNVARMYDGNCIYDLANAIKVAAAQMLPGDVMLIEQQTDGPAATTQDYVPVEFDQSVYSAIRTVSLAGIIVIEAAGNGGSNLDGPEFNSLFSGGRPDSGALIVGAAEAPDCGNGIPRSRAFFSTYGWRVGSYSWGECVTTTGYGDLFQSQSGTPNRFYTARFGGTSSASAIVAASAAVLSSAIEAKRETPAVRREVTTAIRKTGTPQVTGSGTFKGNIGTQPNLTAAMKYTGVLP